jgi:hypothetical protein
VCALGNVGLEKRGEIVDEAVLRRFVEQQHAALSDIYIRLQR